MSRICLLLCFVGTVEFNPVYAWNDAGHMVVARIAWNRLSIEHRENVTAILRHHPHREMLMRKDKPNEATDAEWIFLRAAVWPDHVRPPRNESNHDFETHPIYKFHRGPWHYVNFPYRAGQTTSELPIEPIPPELPDGSNILEQISLCMKLLMNDSTIDRDHPEGVTREQNKAVRMCWLFHLVGDLHQPLHVATLIDERRFPTGNHSDRGGNLLMIRPHAGAPPQTLHHFWDDRVGTNAHFPAVCDLADAIEHDPHLSPDQIPEFMHNHHLRQWTMESYQYAKSTVYHDGNFHAALAKDFQDREIAEDEIPILPQTAETTSKNVARRRVAIAGYRLAGMLRQIFEHR